MFLSYGAMGRRDLLICDYGIFVILTLFSNQGFRCHKLHKAFSNFDLMFSVNCLKMMVCLMFVYSWAHRGSTGRFSLALTVCELKKIGYTLTNGNRLHAWWSTQSRLATLLSSLIACWLVGLYDGSHLKTNLLMRW